MVAYRFNTLEDFLISNPLTIDGVGEDGWGATFPIKGRELEATVLFADISNFSGRTQGLSSTETLAFVNHFFAWISAEALTDTRGIVDKYIGDEIMIVFAREFGSLDPFAEAVKAARHFGEQDAFSFSPHIGIASGPVTVGYVGTPVKYNCSVFGHPVALAARCAGIRIREKSIGGVSIVFPSSAWLGRTFAELFPPREDRFPDGTVQTRPSSWELQTPRIITPKNMDPLEVTCVEHTTVWIPSASAEQWAREHVASIRNNQTAPKQE
jgi:hypothetical protein